MQTELFTVSKIFTENLFRIPDYQRGYSWSQKQLKDFWNDIEQLEEGKNHYTGVLTLEDVPQMEYQKWSEDLWIIEAKKYHPYYVVDGQQRLTTTIILLQAVIERLKDKERLNYTPKEDIRKRFIYESKDDGISRSYIFGYDKDNPSYEFLKVMIFQEQSDIHSLVEETIYTTNLRKAKEFFVEKIKQIKKKSDLEKIYSKITQNLLFNIYTISNDIDVFVAFETMNNRGIPLSHLELLKNRLIFLSTKFKVATSEKSSARKTINESWKTVYHYLGKNENNPLNDDQFLLTHFLLYYGPGILKEQKQKDEYALWQYRHHDQFKNHLLETVFTR